MAGGVLRRVPDLAGIEAPHQSERGQQILTTLFARKWQTEEGWQIAAQVSITGAQFIKLAAFLEPLELAATLRRLVEMRETDSSAHLGAHIVALRRRGEQDIDREIAAQLDPEEWREMVSAYHRAVAEAITRYGGHVAKYLGDGVMASFGWPEAHENDAERAGRAGLAVLEHVSQLNQQSIHPKVSVRVGIDSGSVVVGAGAGKDTDVFGEAPNIAARVQAAAAPDTVVITASTQRLVSGLFVVEDRGAHELKGVANPVELYRVLRPTGVRGRLPAARRLTPFVGREEELPGLLPLPHPGQRRGCRPPDQAAPRLRYRRNPHGAGVVLRRSGALRARDNAGLARVERNRLTWSAQLLRRYLHASGADAPFRATVAQVACHAPAAPGGTSTVRRSASGMAAELFFVGGHGDGLNLLEFSAGALRTSRRTALPRAPKCPG